MCGAGGVGERCATATHTARCTPTSMPLLPPPSTPTPTQTVTRPHAPTCPLMTLSRASYASRVSLVRGRYSPAVSMSSTEAAAPTCACGRHGTGRAWAGGCAGAVAGAPGSRPMQERQGRRRGACCCCAPSHLPHPHRSAPCTLLTHPPLLGEVKLARLARLPWSPCLLLGRGLGGGQALWPRKPHAVAHPPGHLAPQRLGRAIGLAPSGSALLRREHQVGHLGAQGGGVGGGRGCGRACLAAAACRRKWRADGRRPTPAPPPPTLCPACCCIALLPPSLLRAQALSHRGAAVIPPPAARAPGRRYRCHPHPSHKPPASVPSTQGAPSAHAGAAMPPPSPRAPSPRTSLYAYCLVRATSSARRPAMAPRCWWWRGTPCWGRASHPAPAHAEVGWGGACCWHASRRCCKTKLVGRAPEPTSSAPNLACSLPHPRRPPALHPCPDRCASVAGRLHSLPGIGGLRLLPPSPHPCAMASIAALSAPAARLASTGGAPRRLGGKWIGRSAPPARVGCRQDEAHGAGGASHARWGALRGRRGRGEGRVGAQPPPLRRRLPQAARPATAAPRAVFGGGQQQQQYGGGQQQQPPQQQQGYYPPVYQPPPQQQLDERQRDSLSVGTALRNIGWLAFWSQVGGAACLPRVRARVARGAVCGLGGGGEGGRQAPAATRVCREQPLPTAQPRCSPPPPHTHSSR